jgi:hypothetical protein
MAAGCMFDVRSWMASLRYDVEMALARAGVPNLIRTLQIFLLYTYVQAGTKRGARNLDYDASRYVHCGGKSFVQPTGQWMDFVRRSIDSCGSMGTSRSTP